MRDRAELDGVGIEMSVIGGVGRWKRTWAVRVVQAHGLFCSSVYESVEAVIGRFRVMSKRRVQM